MRFTSVIATIAMVGVTGCGKKTPPATETTPVAHAGTGERGEATEAESGANTTAVKKNAAELSPALEPAPTEVAEIGREVAEALRANDVDGLNEVHIKYETYERREVMLGLGIEDRLITKLGPAFFWADTSGDSAEVREALLETYGGKAVEFVKLEYGEHEDNEHLEIWSDLVLTITVDGSEPKPVAALGEVIRDKATGEYWLLRYKARKLPAREVAQPPAEASAGTESGAETKPG